MRKSESVSEKQSLFDERLEWEAATIYPLSWFPFQAWLAIKTLQTAWNWSLTLSDLVTSNPGSEMFLLQSVHTHTVFHHRERTSCCFMLSCDGLPPADSQRQQQLSGEAHHAVVPPADRQCLSNWRLSCAHAAGDGARQDEKGLYQLSHWYKITRLWFFFNIYFHVEF